MPDPHGTQDREKAGAAVSLPLHDRTFDLVLLSNWEDQIIYEPENKPVPQNISPDKNLTTPANKALESGAWTQSIIWSPRAPFRDFTQLEFNHEDDVIPEERQTSKFIETRHAAIVSKRLSKQRRPSDRGRDSELMLATPGTSLTFQMTISMK